MDETWTDSGWWLQEAVMTKAYAVDANFTGADMTNAVIDRVDFSNTKMQGVKFVNAVITGSEFSGADLSGADFEDALIGNEDAKRLCASLPLPPSLPSLPPAVHVLCMWLYTVAAWR